MKAGGKNLWQQPLTSRREGVICQNQKRNDRAVPQKIAPFAGLKWSATKLRAENPARSAEGARIHFTKQ